MINRYLVASLLISTAAGGLAVASTLGWEPVLSAQTSPWLVVLGATAAIGLSIGLSGVLRLADRGRELLAPKRSLSESFEEMADIAEIARRDGLLPAAADPRIRSHPVISAGFHLLLRDSDEGLLRSALTQQGEVECQGYGGARAAGAKVCRLGLVLLTVLAGIAAVVLAGNAQSPAGMPPSVAAAVLAAVGGFFVLSCVGGTLAAALERQNAEQVILTDAAVVTMLAIRAGTDRQSTLARLSQLLPESGEVDAKAAVRQAA